MSQSAAFKIFHTWWGFILPQYANITEYQSGTIGLYLPNNKQATNKHLNADTYTMLTIAGAAERLHNGVRVAINSPEDGVEIYEIIMQHLIDWYNYLKVDSIVYREVPIEGLAKLAELAGEIFPVANRRGYVLETTPDVDVFYDELDAIATGEYIKPKKAMKMSNHTIINEITRLHKARLKRGR